MPVGRRIQRVSNIPSFPSFPSFSSFFEFFKADPRSDLEFMSVEIWTADWAALHSPLATLHSLHSPLSSPGEQHFSDSHFSDKN